METSLNAALPDLDPLGSAAAFAEEIHAVLRTLTLFEGFSEQECKVICNYMRCYAAARKVTVLREGDVGDFMVMVLSGAVDVLKAFGPDDTKVVDQIGAGGILGEMSLIDGQHRFATCITREPADFAVLTRASLNEILVDHPRLGNKLLLILLQLMTQRLRTATTKMLPTLASNAI
jgi:CRP-like cAMP-binding protein